MVPAWACKKDGNQDIIVEALEALGLTVIDAHSFAQYHAGLSDLMVFYGGDFSFVEVKEIGENLNDNEKAFRRWCLSNAIKFTVIDSIEQAIVWGEGFRK